MNDDKKNSRTQAAIQNMKIAIALSDMSAAEICRRAELSPNVLGKFLRNETSITYPNMLAICDVIGVPIGLIDGARQISPARIRLFKAISALSDDKVDSAISIFLQGRD